MDKEGSFKLRYNIIMLLVYIVGAILLVQLFRLQIIKGEEYRKQSDTRLSRETTLIAARGNICDRTGKKIVNNQMQFNVELYRTKVDSETLNNAILDMVNVLEKNGDKIVDHLPIKVDPFEFTEDEDFQKNWKKSNKIDENANAEECFNILKKKFEINKENTADARKIMAIRYEISSNGYSSTRAVRVAKKISRESMLEISERGSNFPGINISTSSSVNYPLGTTASHILGTVGPITEDELKGKESTYDINDIIGKTGVEYVFEQYLKGENGTKQIDMAVDRNYYR